MPPGSGLREIWCHKETEMKMRQTLLTVKQLTNKAEFLHRKAPMASRGHVESTMAGLKDSYLLVPLASPQ